MSFRVISAHFSWARVPGGAVCWADPSSDWCSISFSDWAALSDRNGADILIIGNDKSIDLDDYNITINPNVHVQISNIV